MNDVEDTFNHLQQHIQTTYGVEVNSRYETMNNPGISILLISWKNSK